ncbi:homoserine/Threonine efflux protein [compost metagenome]
MEMGLLTAFWAISFSLVLTPGADWAYAISAGLRDRAIMPAVSGMLLGYLAITLVVAAGVGALVAGVPAVLTVLTVLRAGYLLWLGVGVLAHPPVPVAGEDQAARSWTGWIVRGFAASGINPKALLLFLALLPQFTSRDGSWTIPSQIAALGAVHMLNCALIYSLVGTGSSMVLRTRPRVARLVSQFSGAAMIAIALFLLAEQLVIIR